tara:strand:+ start:284 stop:529 length:246 start_codon:yes stop_codon:yes gene_type:complete
MTRLSPTWHTTCLCTHEAWQNATNEEQKMTTYKPNRSDEWNDIDDVGFDYNSDAYTDSEEYMMEALTVHLGNKRYFEGYAE